MYDAGDSPIYEVQGGILVAVGAIKQLTIPKNARLRPSQDNIGYIWLLVGGKPNIFTVIPADIVLEDGVYLFFDGAAPVIQRVKALVGGDFAVIGDNNYPRVSDANNWPILGHLKGRAVDIKGV